MHVHVELKKVLRIGKSLSFVLPSAIARALGITPETRFFVFIDSSTNTIVYTLRQPNTLYTTVKARLQSRTKGHRYYVLTIPYTYATILGINEGDKVIVELDEKKGKIILRKY